MYEIIPQPGYIVVEPIPGDELNKSKLATVSDGKEHVSTGKALSVSEYAGTYENYPLQVSTDVKVGNIIAYSKYTEQSLKANGVEYHLVRFDKVTAILKESK